MNHFCGCYIIWFSYDLSAFSIYLNIFEVCYRCLVLHIIPGGALLHTVHMFLVPLDCELYAVLEHGRRCPTKLRHSLRRVDGVPLVMALAVRNVGDEYSGAAKWIRATVCNFLCKQFLYLRTKIISWHAIFPFNTIGLCRLFLSINSLYDVFASKNIIQASQESANT